MRDSWMVGLRQVMGIGWIMVTWIYIGTSVFAHSRCLVG